MCGCAMYPGGRITIDSDAQSRIITAKRLEMWYARSDRLLHGFARAEAGGDCKDDDTFDISDPPNDVLLICDGCDKCCHLICAGMFL